MDRTYTITVERAASGSGSGSETDNWVQYWAIKSLGKEIESRKWKYFAVRRAKQIAQERGDSFIRVRDYLGKTKEVRVVKGE